MAVGGCWRNMFESTERARRRVIALSLAAALPACGGATETGSVVAVHHDGRSLEPLEGALVAVVVSDADAAVLYQNTVVYPQLPDDGSARVYELVGGVELPEGRFTLRFDIRPCSGSCQDLPVRPGDVASMQPPDVCQVEFQVRDDQEVTLEVISDEGEPTADCRLEAAR